MYQQRQVPAPTRYNPVLRINIWYGMLLLVISIFVVRLFYLQIIRHDQYRKAAILSQLKQYQIQPDRGVIEAHDGDRIVPIVLNEKRYTLFADPKYIEDADKAAGAVAAAIGGGNPGEFKEKMQANTRYAVLVKKLDKTQKEAVDKLGLKGIGTREESVRTYPQGSLAAQVLGFVNDEGKGSYGVEQALDGELAGVPGQLRAITDASGVPLVSNKDNIIEEPTPGKRVVLTVDISMQRQLEDILKKGLERAKANTGGAIIMDPQTGAVKAMANYPTYNPAEFYKVEDSKVFNNGVVSADLEVGSIMKPLTAAAALDLGVVGRHTTYYDPSFYTIDGAKITNIEEDGGAGTRSVSDILSLSLNTGATWLLMQMGGGEVNEQARNRWHDYMTNHYGFGKPTGIEQGYESAGTVPSPSEGYGRNIQYANTSFGQGMTATPLQMAAALSSVINGGTYYQPRLVQAKEDNSGEKAPVAPIVVRQNVVKPEVSRAIMDMMEEVVAQNHVAYGMRNLRPQYRIGGKTGTAEFARPEGGYYGDRFNGTYMGFVGGDNAEYVIVVRVDDPKVAGYAGSRAAAPIFVNLANMLIDNFSVKPKT